MTDESACRYVLVVTRATEGTRYDGGIAMTEDKVTPQRIMPDSRLRGSDGRFQRVRSQLHSDPGSERLEHSRGKANCLVNKV